MAINVERESCYSAQETADLRLVSLKTVEAERCNWGGIPFSRIGKRVFYRGADIDDYLDGRREFSTAHMRKIEGPAPRPKKSSVVKAGEVSA
jgi:hypothetical protein